MHQMQLVHPSYFFWRMRINGTHNSFSSNYWIGTLLCQNDTTAQQNAVDAGRSRIMSYSFRQRLRMALKDKLNEKLGLTQEDVDYLWDNIKNICPISDELLNALKDSEKREENIDEIVDHLTEQEFEELVAEVLELGFAKLGYKKGKKKKKVEEESETDSDSDSDSDGAEESVEEVEAEAQCKESSD